MAHVPLGYYVEKIAVPILFGSFRLIRKILRIVIEHGFNNVSDTDNEDNHIEKMASDISPQARAMASGPYEAAQYDYDLKYDQQKSLF